MASDNVSALRPDYDDDDLVSYAGAAKRVVERGIYQRFSRQRMRQLHVGREHRGQFTPPDPNFPEPVVVVPDERVVLFRWGDLEEYFRHRDSTPGVHKGWAQLTRAVG